MPNLPPYGDIYRKSFGNFATLFPSAQDTPNMTIHVSAGGFWSYLEGVATYVEYVSGSSPAITAPATGAKWVAVTLTRSGMLQNVNGTTAAESPPLPVIPVNLYPIALVYVRSTDTKLTDENIFDIRPVFQNPVRSHLDLADVDSGNCHQISAIYGLQTILDTLASLTDLSDGLGDKADTTGTSSSYFRLNADETGAPSADAYYSVERGSETNVSIRWNEATDKWEYTEDGITWVTFESAYINDGTQEIILITYEQDDEPILSADGNAAIWIDSDDSDRVYLVYRRGTGDQVKVELT